MHLLIISHKEAWLSNISNYNFETTGGFPFQINAISTLFKTSTLICCLRNHNKPNNLTPLKGKNLSIVPLQEPPFYGRLRQISILFWLPFQLGKIHRSMKKADAVHALIPGDLGLIGIILSLLLRKRLIIRHCGTWGNQTTFADKFIHWLLIKIANGKNIIMATGDNNELPEKSNPNIKWIFSTSLTKEKWENLRLAKNWIPKNRLDIITVCRLTKGKNVESLIRTMKILKKKLPVKLDVVGDGDQMDYLVSLSSELDVEDIVTFYGNCNQKKVMELLSKNNIFVFPTRTKEGFPKALLEAMACGLPVIASRVSTIPFLVENKCGFIIDDCDPISISKAIIQMISDPDNLRLMGYNARKISGSYTIERWNHVISSRIDRTWTNELK